MEYDRAVRVFIIASKVHLKIVFFKPKKPLHNSNFSVIFASSNGTIHGRHSLHDVTSSESTSDISLVMVFIVIYGMLCL